MYLKLLLQYPFVLFVVCLRSLNRSWQDKCFFGNPPNYLGNLIDTVSNSSRPRYNSFFSEASIGLFITCADEPLKISDSNLRIIETMEKDDVCLVLSKPTIYLKHTPTWVTAIMKVELLWCNRELATEAHIILDGYNLKNELPFVILDLDKSTWQKNTLL